MLSFKIKKNLKIFIPTDTNVKIERKNALIFTVLDTKEVGDLLKEINSFGRFTSSRSNLIRLIGSRCFWGSF